MTSRRPQQQDLPELWAEVGLSIPPPRGTAAAAPPQSDALPVRLVAHPAARPIGARLRIHPVRAVPGLRRGCASRRWLAVLPKDSL
eukprot:13151258-Alexandrium_andersonii.AAC.1